MKTKNLFYLIVSLCFVLSACESDDETNGSDGLPEGALPSSEFTPNNLPDEPYADDVIKIVAEDDDAPFYSLELMADGHYLLSLSRPASNLAKAVSEDKTADGACGICQSRQPSAMRTRSVTDEEGTRSSGYGGLYYGTFIKIADHKYRLNNGVEIDFSEYTVSTKTVKYKIPDGVVAVVNVYRVEPLQDVLTRSLCRAWNCNSFEVWGFINDAYVVHGKQTLVDGNVERKMISLTMMTNCATRWCSAQMERMYVSTGIILLRLMHGNGQTRRKESSIHGIPQNILWRNRIINISMYVSQENKCVCT